MNYGPSLPLSEEIHEMKYRQEGESFYDAMTRIAGALTDDEKTFRELRQLLLEQKFLPAGRVQAAIGAAKVVTPYNCFVSGVIDDSMEDICAKLGEAAQVMRMGGGIGYDFSTLRPYNDMISTLKAPSSGPISFMEVYDSMCAAIMSKGNRRGAQMAVMRVDHPDIEAFITAKTNETFLRRFNLSVGITDEFMVAVKQKEQFALRFNGRIYSYVDAEALWEKILRTTWDWAEPGVIFLDTINKKNNLWYCEKITTTNPCAEQPLPPYGACLLGSINLVKFFVKGDDEQGHWFDGAALEKAVRLAVRALDRVVDVAAYPSPMTEAEAKSKRRMGLGVTGMANLIEAIGYPYGSDDYIRVQEHILAIIRNEAYYTSTLLAKEKGTFPLYDEELILESNFIKTLPLHIIDNIKKYGLRNSHLLSIAPTGTISLTADNVSSGIEPVFSYGYDRIVQTDKGPVTEAVTDYGYRVFGVKGKVANDVSVYDHVRVLTSASYFVDSACSKTCNVGDDVTWEEFKDVYMQAYEGGASGCTTFRASGKRGGILLASKDEEVAENDVQTKSPTPSPDEDIAACYIDPTTGIKSCDE